MLLVSYTFPNLNNAKIKEGIFFGPQVRQLMKTIEFEDVMTTIQREAWISFKEVVNGLLDNNEVSNYNELVEDMLKTLRS